MRTISTHRDDSLDPEQWWPENAAERRLDAYEAERIAEKQASRDADEAALADGSKTRERLRHENGLVRIARIDWDNIRSPKR